MFSKILVPLDGSKVGEAALPVIEELIARLPPEPKIEVILFQAIPPTHWIATGDVGAPVRFTDEELQVIARSAIDYLNKAGKALKDRGVLVKTVVAAGNQAVEILKTAEENSVDLIAMSTHGRSGLRRWAFGSVTDKVLRGSRVPVLTVRAPATTTNE